MTYGTFAQPFAANSPWNRSPVNPVFGAATIPTSSYDPAIQGGAYSTGVFNASATPPYPAMLVRAYPGKTINDTDGYKQIQSIAIPHWPPSLFAATGADGHADIADESSDIIHSFYQLKRIDGIWYCSQYSSCKLSSIGWPTPAKPTQGSRAVGVPASAGLIRSHEINDGALWYSHALAMSLTYNALSKVSVNPIGIDGLFTAHDSDVSRNYGQIPYGSLLMLPASFPENQSNLALRKVIFTLKKYGAYVVDRNDGTPFNIYVENGSVPFNIYKEGNFVQYWLNLIRAQLRPVLSVQSWDIGSM